MGNIGFKFQPDRSHGPAVRIIIIIIILIFESVFRDLNRTWYKYYNDVVMLAEACLLMWRQSPVLVCCFLYLGFF